MFPAYSQVLVTPFRKALVASCYHYAKKNVSIDFKCVNIIRIVLNIYNAKRLFYVIFQKFKHLPGHISESLMTMRYLEQ